MTETREMSTVQITRTERAERHRRAVGDTVRRAASLHLSLSIGNLTLAH